MIVAVERGVEIDEVHAGVGQVAELFEAVAAIDDAGIEEGGGFGGGRSGTRERSGWG